MRSPYELQIPVLARTRADLDLNGKVAIVTGASSGIGRAAAKLFARAGAKVVVAARRKAELESLVREIAADGGDAFALAGDVNSDHALAIGRLLSMVVDGMPSFSWRSSLPWARLGFCCSSASGAQAEYRRWEIL